MTLVDTSVWIDHFRKGNVRLRRLLEESEVLAHSFVIGELACGNLRNRHEILGLLQEMPMVPVAEQNETLKLIEAHRLWGKRIGWIGVHLLASALLSRSTLWTSDKKLSSIASEHGVQ